jgi:predicted RecA/RadA family phage recombinase
MGRKVSDGRSVRVTVPQNTTIEAGKFYLLEGFFGLAVQSVTTGTGETAEIILNCEQAEYETSQITTADAFNKGDKVYWDDTNKLLTTNANPDANGNPQNRPVGRVTQAKDANNVIWFVLGPQVQAHA